MDTTLDQLRDDLIKQIEERKITASDAMELYLKEASSPKYWRTPAQVAGNNWNK